MNFKLLTIMLLSIAIFSVAFAYYDVKMDVYPTDGIDKGEDFLVFGYIDSDDISSNDLEIRVYDDSNNLYTKIEPYFDNGFFYKEMDIDETGDYTVKLRVDGTTESTEDIEVDSIGSREVKISDFDYSISYDSIKFVMDIENTDSENHDITVYLKGMDNWDTPAKIKVNVDADDTEHVSRTYALSEFGYGNFIVAAYAKTDSSSHESYSAPEYVFVDAIQDGNDDGASHTGQLDITDVELSKTIFYAGDIIDAYVTVKNYGSNEVQYKFEYIVGNEVYTAGDVGYIQGDSTGKLTVPVEVPDADSFKLTVKVWSNSFSDSYSNTYLISQRMKYMSITTDKESTVVGAGNDTVLKLTIKNRGNENDVYKIDVSGWEYYIMNDTVAINAAKNKTMDIVFEIPEDYRVGTYPVTVQVCNLEEFCRTKMFNLTVSKPESGQSMIAWNEKTVVKFKENGTAIVYEFNITNDGNREKSYIVKAKTSEGLASEISENAFTLESDEQRTIVLELTPAEQKNYTAEVKIASEGTVILDKEIKVEYSEHPEGDSGLTGMFINGVEGSYLPGLVALALIGVVFLVLTFYKQAKRRFWTEKVISYQKPNVYSGYTDMHPRSNMAQVYGPQPLMPQSQLKFEDFKPGPQQPPQEDQM